METSCLHSSFFFQRTDLFSSTLISILLFLWLPRAQQNQLVEEQQGKTVPRLTPRSGVGPEKSPLQQTPGDANGAGRKPTLWKPVAQRSKADPWPSCSCLVEQLVINIKLKCMTESVCVVCVCVCMCVRVSVSLSAECLCVCLCMCMSLYIFIRLCMCLCVYMYVCAWICVSEFVSVHMSVCVCVWVCVYVCVCVYMCVSVSVCSSMCVSVWVCIYAYVYVCVCVNLCVSEFVSAYVCVCEFVSVCVCLCVCQQSTLLPPHRFRGSSQLSELWNWNSWRKDWPTTTTELESVFNKRKCFSAFTTLWKWHCRRTFSKCKHKVWPGSFWFPISEVENT